MRENLPDLHGTWAIDFLLLTFLLVAGILPSLFSGPGAGSFAANTYAQPQAKASPCPPGPTPSTKLPGKPDHVVVVIEENKGYEDVIGSLCRAPGSNKPQLCAPYLNSLADKGASLTQFFAFHHPSQPNYIEFFSGSNQGVINDCCPLVRGQPQEICLTWQPTCPTNPDKSLSLPAAFPGPSLGGRLIEKNFSFTGFAEDLPDDVRACCDSKYYARKHCPWLDFQDVPAKNPDGSNTTIAFDPNFWKNKNNFSKLPALAFVIPNLINDMHSLPEHAPGKTWPEDYPEKSQSSQTPSKSDVLGKLVRQGDDWLRENLDEYVNWAMDEKNNSLLIITWDEDSQGKNCTKPCPTTPPANRIPTIIVGARVKRGYKSAVQYTHYSLLRTLQELYAVEWCKLIGGSQRALPISDIWK